MMPSALSVLTTAIRLLSRVSRVACHNLSWDTAYSFLGTKLAVGVGNLVLSVTQPARSTTAPVNAKRIDFMRLLDFGWLVLEFFGHFGRDHIGMDSHEFLAVCKASRADREHPKEWCYPDANHAQDT